ncbi:MAG TPA: ribonuclease D [Steroidobacteraceae bacterium]|jgi:ribonuclease D
MNQTDSPDIVRDDAALAQIGARLAGAEYIGLDTEFLRERTYFAQLCLLQLSAGEDAWCVDTLALPTLASLRAALNRAPPCKILHAARQDLEVLWPASGAVTGIFDTQVAAALIGMPAQIGYGDLVRRLLGKTLHKAETRTDWSRRPLSAAQIEYALDDVRYLLPLREQLQAQLQQLGRWPWFMQEMAELDAMGSFDADPQQAWRRFKGFHELDAERQRLAVGLCAWREQRAIDADRPRNWILPDSALRDIVWRAPRSMAELAGTAELAEGIRNNSGAQILAVVEGAALPERLPPLPQRQRPDPQTTAAVRKLAQLAQQVGRELGLAPEILATRREMERLVAGSREGGVLQGWRREVIGERLLAAL